jgi:hypothetical protein
MINKVDKKWNGYDVAVSLYYYDIDFYAFSSLNRIYDQAESKDRSLVF